MPLYDNPPHRADIYSVASSADTGAGTALTYTLVQSSVPCWAPSLVRTETERFAQMQIPVEQNVYFKASALTVDLNRGWKIIVSGVSIHITGLDVSLAAGTIPSLVEVKGEQLL